MVAPENENNDTDRSDDNKFSFGQSTMRAVLPPSPFISYLHKLAKSRRVILS